MTRRLMGLAVAAVAASAIALPAAPASAQCTGTFVFHCVREVLEQGTPQSDLCLFRDDTTGTYVCLA